jgi:uncharacterized membrane protein (DUF2068 family)
METGKSDRSASANATLGLRTLASFEAAKGAIVLLIVCGVLHLIHKNQDDMAERLAEVLHVNPKEKLSGLFLELASHATDRGLCVLAIGALVYAGVRSIEAYGLWRAWEWAQWFELLSTALYLPAELYWLLHHPSWLKWGVLATNLVVLMFMVVLRVNAAWHQQHRRSDRVAPARGSVSLGAR